MAYDSIEKALNFLTENGVIEERGTPDAPTFIPCVKEDDEPGFLETERNENVFSGFADPTANYFMVPAIWTNLTREVNSATVILSVEYFFRHTWGWQGGGDEPRWMDADEVANGRRYRSEERQGERYDGGVGYSKRSVRDALNEGVERGWLAWRPSDQGREYALHLEGMEVTDGGRWVNPDVDAAYSAMLSSPVDTEFLSPRTQLSEIESAPVEEKKENDIDNNNTAKPESDAEIARESGDDLTAKIVLLEAQVATLTKMMQSLVDLMSGIVDVDIGDIIPLAPTEAGKAPTEASKAPTEANVHPSTEASKAPTEASKAPTEVSKAPTEVSKAHVVKTPLDTLTTPPPNTAPTREGTGGGGGATHSSTTTAVVNRLTNLDPPMSEQKASELVAAHGAQSIQAWLRVLERDPTVRSVAALLIHKLKSGEPVPGNGRGERKLIPNENCPYCHGTGRMMLDVPETDPSYGEKVPCFCTTK